MKQRLTLGSANKVDAVGRAWVFEIVDAAYSVHGERWIVNEIGVDEATQEGGVDGILVARCK